MERTTKKEHEEINKANKLVAEESIDLTNIQLDSDIVN